MAAASNPYRRKQDAILGVNVSNQHSRPSSQATFGCRDAGTNKSIRSVKTIPAQISQFQQIPEHHTLASQDDINYENDIRNLMDIRREIESVYNGSDYQESYTMSPTSDTHDPLDDLEEGDEDENDDEEYDSLEDDMSMYGSSIVPPKRTHTSKRMAELQQDSFAGRSSSALGYRSGSTDSTALPSKAERMLGLSAKRGHSSALAPAPRHSKSKKGGLAPKAQRLLGVRPEALKKAAQEQHEKGSIDGSSIISGMTMERGGSEVDDFKRLLLGGRTSNKGGYRKVTTDSVSDASSLSRNSMVDSQTSRSSRELLSPDAETPTWTSPTAAPPPWLGIHPAFRKVPSVDSDTFSPISPKTVVGAPSPKHPMFADFKSMNAALLPSNPIAVELDAGPIGPVAPVELPVPESDSIARHVPTNVHEMSSVPPSPREARPRTSENELGPKTSNSSLLAKVFVDRPSSADGATGSTPQRKMRPSAIFDNPNIFEMPGDMPEITTPPVSIHKQEPPVTGSILNSFPTPPTPPPSSRSLSSRVGNLQRTTSHSPSHPQSPYAPPSRPLPPVPAQRSTSGDLATVVTFSSGRTRQQSEEVHLSPRSFDSRSLKSQPSIPEAQRSNGTLDTPPPLTALSVPSPLAMALAEGKPITKDAPPPLRSADDYAPSGQKVAAQGQKKRVPLSDKSSPKSKRHTREINEDDETESIHRPFSWQSTRTNRSLRMDDGAPPMPPPLALTIPTEAVRRAASHNMPGNSSGAMTATPLTATSARSRASRLQKALEQALSKDGMDKAVLGGEKIEDLFRSAGAEELFIDCSKESRELIGLEPGEDTQEARQAAHRAQDLLKDLNDLQREVDQLRQLYTEGGPLEGMGPDQRDWSSTV